MSLPEPPLLVITDRRLADRPLPQVAERLFACGVRWLSLRDKDLPDGERVELARALVVRAGPWGARITLHGDPALAAAAGVDGVHLPSNGDPAAARALLGVGALIGLSFHDSDGAEAMERAAGQADYVTLSPVFPSASKPGYGPCLGAAGLRRWVALGVARGVPVIGLGGLDRADAVAECRVAGAAGVAVMGLAMRDAQALAPLLAALAPAGSATLPHA
ncbi:thiamine-phosphate pyrophosphorylase [Azospirillum lipoferum]|uniref:Thiamine phosphate synthase n=1 Tax=Azospirillum lipoferum TaxID=193 RepID=A0A5A9GKF8_AZOLI|nr:MULTISPECIES: thiamine phosphate synthase [Azospirillum]KAA0594813.1 thiamine phosphate synthase [Azospirillum lipoferum]MCP1612863.1 thiamine-phosphate pyrophosphorylase [Azospirillum lipoferum]MDW5531998.1 thiamine phosphate synthase [Azospirillum sp. NL1]